MVLQGHSIEHEDGSPRQQTTISTDAGSGLQAHPISSLRSGGSPTPQQSPSASHSGSSRLAGGDAPEGELQQGLEQGQHQRSRGGSEASSGEAAQQAQPGGAAPCSAGEAGAGEGEEDEEVYSASFEDGQHAPVPERSPSAASSVASSKHSEVSACVRACVRAHALQCKGYGPQGTSSVC